MSPSEAAPVFFLAVVVILVVVRLVCLAAVKLGQPPVVGEMIAGVLLGPSLLGLVLPGVQDALFPDAVRPMIYVVSHIGLVAFMFGVGHEFAQQKVRGLGRPAATVSLAGVTAPLWLRCPSASLNPRPAGHLVGRSDCGTTAAAGRPTPCSCRARAG